MSKGYGIVARNVSKIAQLTEETFMATSGMYADFTALTKNLKAQLTLYRYDNQRDPETKVYIFVFLFNKFLFFLKKIKRVWPAY